MLHDYENQLAHAAGNSDNPQAFLGASPGNGANAYDTRNAAADPSIGARLAILFYPRGTIVAGGATSFQFRAIQSAASNLGTPDVLAQVEMTNAVINAIAASKTNNWIEIPIPQGVITKRWVGVQVAPAGSPSGTSNVDGFAYIVQQKDVPYFKTFPKAVLP